MKPSLLIQFLSNKFPTPETNKLLRKKDLAQSCTGPEYKLLVKCECCTGLGLIFEPYHLFYNRYGDFSCNFMGLMNFQESIICPICNGMGYRRLNEWEE
jgi:hypothetical protein